MALNARLTISESSDHLCALFHHPKLSQHPSNAVLNGIIRLTFPLVLRSYLSHKACNWGFVRALSAASLRVVRIVIKGRPRSAFYIPRDIEQEDLLVEDFVRHVRKDMIVKGGCVVFFEVVKEVQNFMVRGVIGSESRRDG